MEKRSVDDWDGEKIERLAREYVEVRSEMWETLARRFGEKWQTVEAKVSILLIDEQHGLTRGFCSAWRRD